jgi:hypothetical protein
LNIYLIILKSLIVTISVEPCYDLNKQSTLYMRLAQEVWYNNINLILRYKNFWIFLSDNTCLIFDFSFPSVLQCCMLFLICFLQCCKLFLICLNVENENFSTIISSVIQFWMILAININIYLPVIHHQYFKLKK